MAKTFIVTGPQSRVKYPIEQTQISNWKLGASLEESSEEMSKRVDKSQEVGCEMWRWSVGWLIRGGCDCPCIIPSQPWSEMHSWIPFALHFLTNRKCSDWSAIWLTTEENNVVFKANVLEPWKDITLLLQGPVQKWTSCWRSVLPLRSLYRQSLFPTILILPS